MVQTMDQSRYKHSVSYTQCLVIMYSSIARGSFLSKKEFKEIKMHWIQNIKILQIATVFICNDQMRITFCSLNEWYILHFNH